MMIGTGPARVGRACTTMTAIALLAAGIAACSQQQSHEAPAQAASVEHPGKAVYESACAACHNNPEATRSPSVETLRQMQPGTIAFALTQGKMQMQATGLTAEERQSVVEYLTGRPATLAAGSSNRGRKSARRKLEPWIAGMMCPANRRAVDLSATPTMTGFGFDKLNHRHLDRTQAGLATADFRNLELAWAIGFPQVTMMRAQPAVVGSMLFLPVAESARLFGIDIEGNGPGRPCVKWVYENDVPLRTSAAYGELPGSGRKVVVLADGSANIHMIDALTGAGIWKQHVGLYEYSITTGTPVLYKDRVYAPVSQYEITLGGNPQHLCCKTHGAVVALQAQTGEPIWTAHTMPEAQPVRDRGDGQMLWGPSGAPIWTSPAIDAKRGVLYVGTGEATSAPVAATTDAILAIDLQDGSLRWSFQATANDIFLLGCDPTGKGLNCESNTVFRDVDFGASVIIAQRSDGSDILLAGQKAGTLWALDPDNQGKVLWRQDFGQGSPLGGIHWGIAADSKHVFAPINRMQGRIAGRKLEPDLTVHPGIHAVNIDSGEVAWSFEAQPDCSGERRTRIRGCAGNIGLSAAPAVIDGAVIEGSVDGFIRAFDAATGELLFQFDTAKRFITLNGVPANGGAIDSAAIAAARGYLFVGSGYGMFGQPAGNVLLAFKVK